MILNNFIVGERNMKKSSKVLWIFAGVIFAVVLILSISLQSNNYFSNRHISSSFSFNFFNSKKITGNKNIISKSVALTDFNTINAAEDLDVTFQSGTQNTATITSDENILPYINLTQENNQLFLDVQPDVSISPSKTDKVMITSSTMLHYINIDGIASIHAMNLDSDDLTLNMHGMSSGNIQGNINNIHINLSGKPVLHLKILDAENVFLVMRGSGTVYLSGNTQNLTLSSNGNATVLGNNLVADNVEITARGRSDISVHAVKTLSISTSGQSSIKYAGNPSINKNTSGDAIIEKSGN